MEKKERNDSVVAAMWEVYRNLTIEAKTAGACDMEGSANGQTHSNAHVMYA